MYIKKNQYLTLLLLSIITGCASKSEQLGINQLEWESYSSERQKIVHNNYTTLTKERLAIIKNQKDTTFQSSSFLNISIRDGKIMFPPAFINWQDYKPIEFTIASKQCLEIEVLSLSAPNTQTKLGACLYDNILHLDPSKYDVTQKLGSIHIPYSPLWPEGFSYKEINSNGYLRFNNVTIEVKQITKSTSVNN